MFDVFDNNRALLIETSNAAESQFRCIKHDTDNRRSSASIGFQKLLDFVKHRSTNNNSVDIKNYTLTIHEGDELMQASAGNYASYRRQHVDAKTDSDVVADSTGLTVVDTNNNNNNNTNNNNIIIINNEKKKKQLSDAVRPPKTQQEITTLRKLTPKEQRKKSRNETQLMQTIPFLNISKTMDAMYLLIATMAMNDIKEQQQFEHASTNNILNFAGGALDLLLSHNRTRTTKTIAQLHDLFTQYTPTIIIDPPTTNDSTNNNKRRNTLLASDIVDAKIRVLLRSFVVDKATHSNHFYRSYHRIKIDSQQHGDTRYAIRFYVCHVSIKE